MAGSIRSVKKKEREERNIEREENGKEMSGSLFTALICLGISVLFMLILFGAFGKAGDYVNRYFFLGIFGFASYGAAIAALRACLRRFFPALEKADEEVFIYAFLPFLFGVYPYAHATQKQISAMQKAGVKVPSLSEFSLVSDFLKALLKGLLKK